MPIQSRPPGGHSYMKSTYVYRAPVFAPGASSESKIIEKYGVIGWETAFWSKIMWALGENVFFGLSMSFSS